MAARLRWQEGRASAGSRGVVVALVGVGVVWKTQMGIVDNVEQKAGRSNEEVGLLLVLWMGEASQSIIHPSRSINPFQRPSWDNNSAMGTSIGCRAGIQDIWGSCAGLRYTPSAANHNLSSRLCILVAEPRDISLLLRFGGVMCTQYCNRDVCDQQPSYPARITNMTGKGICFAL